MRSIILITLLTLAACAGEPETETARASIVGRDAHVDDTHASVVAVSGGGRLCTGTVIGRDAGGQSLFVLTAAHCCRSSSPPERIRVGSDTTDPARSLPVTDFYQHPCYNPISHDYDVCVLRVDDDHSLNVTPIPPASAPDGLARGSEVTFVGYGSTPAVNVARRRVGAVLSEISPLTIGADQRGGRGGICFGDSGGPALVIQNGVEVVAGVSSFGAPSSLCNATGVAGRVSHPAIREAFIDKILAGEEPRIRDSFILRGGASPGRVRDTYIASDMPNHNLGDDVELLVGHRNGATRRALLRFDLSGIPSGVTVVTASIGLHRESVTGPQTITVHRVTKDWDEDRETWASFGAGGFVEAPLASVSNVSPIVAMTEEVWFDVSKTARDWISGEAPNHGILIQGQGARETQLLASELGRVSERPWMHVCYLPASK